MGLIRSLDCYRDVGLSFRLWGTMLTQFRLGEFLTDGWQQLGLSVGDWCVLAVGILVMSAASQIGKREPIRDRLARRPVALCVVLTLGVVVILIFGTYGIGYNAGDFIYVQF